jgi:hypothetical protein
VTTNRTDNASGPGLSDPELNFRGKRPARRNPEGFGPFPPRAGWIFPSTVIMSTACPMREESLLR